MAWPWRTIADAECDANSPIKQQLIEAEYYNLLAAMEGSAAAHAAGAPYIQGSAILAGDLGGDKMADGTLRAGWMGALSTDKFADGVVIQGDLTISNEVQSWAYASPFSANLAFGAQTFYKMGWGTWATSGMFYNAILGIGQTPNITSATYTTYAHIKYVSGTFGTANFKIYYINASPPYDIGHGQTAGFIYARLDAAGEVLQVRLSGDPPWYQSPPSSAIVNRGGTDYHRRRIQTLPATEAIKDPATWERHLDEIRNPQYEEIEINTVYKNANMGGFAHPFLNLDPGDRVVLLEPSGDLVVDAMDLHLAGEDVIRLIHDGDIKINPAPIAGHNAPNGVIPVRAGWR